MAKEADAAIWNHLESLGIGNPDRSSGAAAGASGSGPAAGSPKRGWPGTADSEGRPYVESVDDRLSQRTLPVDAVREFPESGETF